jgi:hypothetical protein
MTDKSLGMGTFIQREDLPLRRTRKHFRPSYFVCLFCFVYWLSKWCFIKWADNTNDTEYVHVDVSKNSS